MYHTQVGLHHQLAVLRYSGICSSIASVEVRFTLPAWLALVHGIGVEGCHLVLCFKLQVVFCVEPVILTVILYCTDGILCFAALAYFVVTPPQYLISGGVCVCECMHAMV